MKSHRKVAFLFAMVYAGAMKSNQNLHPGLFHDMSIIPVNPFDYGIYSDHAFASMGRSPKIILDELNFILANIGIQNVEYTRKYFKGQGKDKFVSKFTVFTTASIIPKLTFDELLSDLTVYRDNGDWVEVRGSPLLHTIPSFGREALIEPFEMNRVAGQLISMVEDFIGVPINDITDVPMMVYELSDVAR